MRTTIRNPDVKPVMTLASYGLTYSLNPGNVLRVGDARIKEFTRKIRELGKLQKIFVRRDHIEKDRVYREITVDQVWRVLSNGQVSNVRNLDSSVHWQGHDENGRLIELNCTLRGDDGEIAIGVGDAQVVVIGTAYDPSLEDDVLKARWLAEHPEYEDAGKRKGVQKKVMVTRI